jgi:hypothetical protein
MARRVFVHVGAPKTGSTYVQDVLWSNRFALKRTGVLLPGDARAHDEAMADLRGVPWRDATATWSWDKLVEKVRRWPGDAIISNEGLGAATAEQAERAVRSLEPAEVHVIVAGRDLWRTFPSMWQQSIRARSVWRFEEFVEAVEAGEFEHFWEQHTPTRMLRRWGDLVPPARRHLVTVPPPGARHDVLWQRFAGIIGITDGVCEVAEPVRNVSLGASEIEVLRRVNEALGDRFPHRTPYQRVVQRHLVDGVLKRTASGSKFGVGVDRAGWVSGLAEEQIRELRDYPCEVAGDLEELRPGRMEATSSPDELDDGQVLEAAISAIVGMLEHTETLSVQADKSPEQVVDRLQKRVRRGVRNRLRYARRQLPLPRGEGGNESRSERRNGQD